MEFKDILAQFEAPTQDVDWDLYYKDISITYDQIAQLRQAFEVRLAIQGATNDYSRLLQQ